MVIVLRRVTFKDTHTRRHKLKHKRKYAHTHTHTHTSNTELHNEGKLYLGRLLHRLQENIKLKQHNTLAFPVLLYGNET